MKTKFDFLEKRERLGEQYVQAWHNEECYRKVDALNNAALEYVLQFQDQPHSVMKAKGVDYVLQHAEVYINPEDPFGIALTAQKMNPILDLGCHYMDTFSRKLQAYFIKELEGQLYPEETKAYLKNTVNYMLNEMYIDYNHSTPSWDSLFSLGLCGVLERVKSYEAKLRGEEELSRKQEEYFAGIYAAYEALFAYLDRLIDELERYEKNMESRDIENEAQNCGNKGVTPHLEGGDGTGYGADCKVEEGKANIKRMREAFCHLRYNPPSDLYEALLFGWFYWYVQELVEGQRVRTMGGLDRLYYPFYQKAVETGEYTREEMVDLFACFMNVFYAFRTGYQQPMFLGGRNEDGSCVVNELSYIILDAYNLLSRPNPKLQAVISEETPQPFLLKVMDTIRRGNSSISIINDEVAMKAMIRLGAPEKEAMTYIMSGCWDYAIKDHEVKTIPVRINLPKLVELVMTDGVCLTTGAVTGVVTGHTPENFDDFMGLFWKQFDYTWNKVRAIIENWEKYLADINPSNLYSATMTDSLKRAADGYACGMKYNTTVYSMAGIASLIDELLAIRHFVYEKKRVTLPELLEILKKDWAGYEELRREIINDDAKYGNGSKEADVLTADICHTIARKVNGVPNSRGGFWKIGLLSIDKNVRFGACTIATAEGRKAGEPFSKNLNPCLGMDRKGITATMNSVTHIDFTESPHAAMIDFVLHPSAVEGDDGLEAFAALVRTYFKIGGHSVQFNIFDKEALKAAQREPEKYRNLQVRVCGWNVYFVDLEKVIQDEFIARAE